MKIPERRQRPRSVVFILNFEHVSHLVLVLLLLTLIAGWHWTMFQHIMKNEYHKTVMFIFKKT